MNSLKDKMALITGGAGFVGSSIADQLIKEGVKEILLLDNLIRGSENNIKHLLSSGKINFIKGDIRDRGLLEDTFKGIDYCFHMAALRITHCAAEPRQALEVMFEGTFNVAESCVNHGVEKVLLASSASLYGQADTFPTNEAHHPYNNFTLYGAAKASNELMFRSFYHMYGLKFVAMRYFNIYGPRMDIYGKYTEVLIKWYDMIREGERPLIYGDGKQTMDFVYVEDVARASISALKSDIKDEVFNVASGRETSLEELCWLLLEVMGSDLKPKFIPITDNRRRVEVERRLAETKKAERMIGFKARTDLREGLKNLVKWLDKEKRKVLI
ncbi:MAG: SDR family NAD(P)-dependent oxidoreductase [Candidatus Omnitrophica bacterium]|nr:SDR family NAD(P)-dependent oxidoreductase [Candidatus Omnitrophota bacterium]